MMKSDMESEINALARELENRLFEKYGVMVSGDALRRELGYSTMGALRQAVYAGKLPVPTFIPKNRRSRYALTRDIAKWLAEERLQSCSSDIDKIEESK